MVLSILSGRPIRIDQKRSHDKDPGLRDYKATLLRLLEKVTNGSVVEISYTDYTSRKVCYRCPLSRSVGYFLEPLIMLVPFPKTALHLTLKDITTDDRDLSLPWRARTVTLPHLQPFGIKDTTKRGALPLRGGQIQFAPLPTSHAVRVSPQFSNQLIDSSRSVLNRYIPDIDLYSDVYEGVDSAKYSPSYALSFVAESTTSVLHCSEAVSSLASRGGFRDRKNQCLVLLMMVLGSEEVGRVKIGELSPRTIQFLRDTRDFFGTSFKIVPTNPSDPASELVMSCYGTRFVKANRAISEARHTK
ncbi:RNA 3'-terminal phosphate cyclase/enolpyruvate transferase [Gautieria morchelliformis]|nr:RNA 3'-terminal phosphate cyclase/enolpyruvate transferase [Gautieria morchelliformis]